MSIERRARGGSAALTIMIFALAPIGAFAQDVPPSEAQAAPAQAAPAQPGQAEAAPPEASEAQTAAQPQTAAPAQDNRPLPPPPPRPQGAQNYNGGAGYQQPPEGDGVYRPISFTLGAGPGFLRLNSDEGKSTTAGLSYALRLGFGVQEDLLLTLAFEGSSARKNGTLASQDAWLLGLQYFFAQVVYVRGAMGIVHEVEEDTEFVYMDQRGFGLQGALGVDLLQAEHVSLSLEANVLHGRYSAETWTGGGLNLLFSIY